MTTHAHAEGSSRPARRWSAAGLIAFCGFLLIAAFFLFSEHRAHLLGWLPFLLLAACPLLHLFHHRGHGDAPSDGDAASTARDPHAGHGGPSEPGATR